MFLEHGLGYGWVTEKLLEGWQTGAVTFVHPLYDRQGNVLPTLEQCDAGVVADPEIEHLARWLRVPDPDTLCERVDTVDSSPETYEWLRDTQWKYFVALRERNQAIRIIEARLRLAEPVDGIWTPPSRSLRIS
jgi:hypothetical protein